MAALDYKNEDFTAPGFYLVSFGGDPPPDGPFESLGELVAATGLDDYPPEGYIVHFDGERLATVPSLNPDLFHDYINKEGA